MDRAGTVFLGIALLVLGFWFLLSEYGVAVPIPLSWPTWMSLIGICLVVVHFFVRPRKAHLVGGAILAFLGIFFLIARHTRGGVIEGIWPGLLVAAGAGMILAGALDSAYRQYIGRGLVLVAAGGSLLFFTLSRWPPLDGMQFIGIVGGALLVAFGVKVLLDSLLRGKKE